MERLPPIFHECALIPNAPTSQLPSGPCWTNGHRSEGWVLVPGVSASLTVDSAWSCDPDPLRRLPSLGGWEGRRAMAMAMASVKSVVTERRPGVTAINCRANSCAHHRRAPFLRVGGGEDYRVLFSIAAIAASPLARVRRDRNRVCLGAF